ncbi:MAG TPA: hypothetical protein VNO21_17005, partial [Polyangiaceae bacterium]|nr:hypothetical protein [Polyangiaceae bacterium]
MMRRPRFTAAQFVAWTIRHGRLLWILALVLAIPATARTVWLYAHLRSDLEELLPRDSPSVVAIDEFRQRAGAHQYLGVVVDAGRRENNRAAEHFLDDLASRVRGYPSDLVATVRTGNQEERAFLDQYGPLYMEAADLQTLLERIVSRRDYEVTRATGAALEDDDPPPALDFSDIQSKYDHKSERSEARQRSRYTDEEKHLSVLLIELQDSTGTGAGRRLFARIHADIASLGGT